MKLVRWLFFAHVAALLFGLLGLLIMVPHHAVWANIPRGADIYHFGISYAGSTHILFGAATMLLFGLLTLGARKTLSFFAVATLLPLCMELLGTTTGWPFGPYEYTSGLGYKIAGHVPFSIPLSWFYAGFTCYLLAAAVVVARQLPRPGLTTLLLGAWLLTAWDLVLDPAMASDSLSIRFWVWHTHGIYAGMPLSNLAGWSLTGLAFMTIARWLWRSDSRPQRAHSWLPFAVYAANMLFAICLSLSVGLWLPVLLALALGLAPASLAFDAVRIGGAGGRGGWRGIPAAMVLRRRGSPSTVR